MTATPQSLPGRARRACLGALVSAAVLLGLGACSLRAPEPVSGADWAARRDRLLALSAWHLRARIAVKADTGGGQGDLQWQQQGEQTRIRVNGPFGAGAYEIRWDPGFLSVTSRNGEISRSWSGQDAAEQFLAEQLGWSFPAISTRYWLLGLPDPGSPARETFSPEGRLAALDQSGWTVTYERYVEVSRLSMPAKIVLQNPRARLRLVIDRWNF
jgi:outer membrane lipoprotein LolB